MGSTQSKEAISDFLNNGVLKIPSFLCDYCYHNANKKDF